MLKNKRILPLLLISACVIASLPGVIAAKSGTDDYVLPEKDGIYDVPGKPGVKLRVFVHQAKDKDAVSRPAPAPVETCGLADPESTSVVPKAGWKLPAGAWTYSINRSSVPGTIGGDKVYGLVHNAYASWQTALTDAGITFNQSGADTAKTSAKLDYQNIITWGRAPSNALAVTYTWSVAGVAIESDVVMNSRYRWYWSDPSSVAWQSDPMCAYQGVYDAQDILTHELGHTVGLDDTYDLAFKNNTMYGYGATGETKKDTLTIGDIAGAKTVYGL